jgi:hypothetical protein
MNSRRYGVGAVVIAVVLLVWAIWHGRAKKPAAPPQESGATSATPLPMPKPSVDSPITTLIVHNVRLKQGQALRVYVRWIRGQMVRTRADRTPSLDDMDSFVFAIDKGVVRANLGDLEKFLNTSVAPKSPLKNMKVSGQGSEIKIAGSLHKWLMTLPVEVEGTFSPTSDGRVHLHVTKIHVLKMPVKALMGGFKVEMKDIVGTEPLGGVEIKGDDVYVDTAELLPPPRIRGKLTSISIQAPDIVAIYGNAPKDETELAQWHNVLGLRGGEVGFGRLTMKNTDLTLIDVTNEDWFDLDLPKYQAQLVRGYSRMTPQGGLEMFMPSVDAQMPAEALTRDILKDKNREIPVPIPAKK